MAIFFSPQMIGPNSRNGVAGAELGGELGLSFREFVRTPTAIGSAFPASHRMVGRMLAPVDWAGVRLFIEYGPGTGRFTRAALARLRSDATLLAIDTSAAFTAHLAASIADPRLRAITASAADVRQIIADQGLGRVDCILSGLPFSTVPPDQAQAIMDASRSVLTRDGWFLAYQMRRAIAPLLRDHFLDVRHERAWRNIPPCHLYRATGPRPAPIQD